MGGEVGREQLQRRGEVAGRREVVDRLDQGAAEQDGPDAVDGRPGEVRVPGVDDPGGKLLARGARAGHQLGSEGHARRGPSTGFWVLRSRGWNVPSPSLTPRRLEWTPPKKAARPRKSSCFQGWNGWSWHWAQSSRTPRNARATRAASALGVGALGLLVAGHREEVRRRVVGPEAPVGDQVADDRVVAAALQDRVAEPGDEPAAAEDEERAVLGADEGAGEALGEVVGGAAVAQEVVEPGLIPPRGGTAPRSGGSPPATGPSRSGRARAVA